MTRLRTVGVIQARMSSSRLPGKALMDLGGMPLLAFMVERVARATSLDDIIIATSTHPSDDPLDTAMTKLGRCVFRGSLDDVLARFVGAAEASSADIIVRMTGDCPLIDPELIDLVVAAIKDGLGTYASNSSPPSYPDGLDCEAFTAELLMRAHREARRPSEREHVTPFMRLPGKAQCAVISSAIDLSALRWTVDYVDDLELVRKMVEGLGRQAILADRFDYLRVFEQLGHSALRHRHDRNEGYLASLANDKKQPDARTIEHSVEL